MHRSVLQYLDDIIEAIGNIDEDTTGISFDDFVADRRRKDAVIRNFEVIGEATKNLPDNLKEQYPNTDWRKISGFRDVLSHAYFGIKTTILWDNIKNKLPVLKTEIRQIIRIEESRK
ncbi:MAG: DUF86 domain-containing protein [Methanomicrobiales archaeon]